MFQKDKGNFSCGRKLMLQSSLVKIHFAPWLLPMKWSQSFFKVPFEFEMATKPNFQPYSIREKCEFK